MEYRIGDKVRITKRDGEGETGVIIKISEVDPKFKYCVGTGSNEYWKEEQSIELLNPETTYPCDWGKPAKEPVSVPAVAQKRRGGPTGSVTQAKPKKESAKPKTKQVQEDISSRYHAFLADLSLADFIEIRSLINRDYEDLQNLVKGRLGLRGDE